MTSASIDAPFQSSPAFNSRGKILRKKNISAEYLKLAIQEDDKEKSTTVYVPRNEREVRLTPTDFHFLYLDAIIDVSGYTNADGYRHVTDCNLVRCAPNVKLIKEVLALNNYLSFASSMNVDKDDLRLLVAKSTGKCATNTIIEKITGKVAKAPPKYRPGRVKKSDVRILESKEAEGLNDSNITWRLCQPCQSLNNSMSFNRKKESVVNLPDGADDLISAHGKLTRSEYLETKKNNQAGWFIDRIRQFNMQQQSIRFLDVGGGRGDLAVQIAINFSHAQVVVVDCNKSSIDAGRDYAIKCGVGGRIQFCCMNFTDYADHYEADGENRVHFVVALHACGDLSDMALSFASKNRCNFIICPCCYPKRYLAPFVPYWHGLCEENEVDSLSRLAELDDHRKVSRRAMLVVNSMRKSAFGGENVRLEEFDDKISKRNIALVGLRV